MNTDTKKRARVHSLREWGRVKQKLCKQAYKIFAFFCQSQLDGIIRAHLLNPWLVLRQPRPARGMPKIYIQLHALTHKMDKVVRFCYGYRSESEPPLERFFCGLLAVI
jgi:hypothetical protein